MTQAQVQSVTGDASKIPESRFKVGMVVRLDDDVERLRIARYQHGHTQEEISDDILLAHLKNGVQIIGVEKLSTPVANLASAAAEDCHFGLHFGLPPNPNQFRTFPEWQFELSPRQ